MSEIDRLQVENQRLSDEVKRLVTTESRLYEVQEHLDGQMSAYRQLYELGKKFNTTVDLATILQLAAEFILYELNFERCLFLLKQSDADIFSIEEMDGYYEDAERTGIAGLALPTASLALAPLYAGVEQVLCLPDCDGDELTSLRHLIGMDEYVILPLGGEPKNPIRLLVAGNTAARAPYQRRVVQDGEALLGLANLVSQTSTAIANASFYQALEWERQSLEEKVRERTRELSRSLDEQTAMAGILKVIASSPSDVWPVFEAIAERANQLIGGHSTGVFRIARDVIVLAVFAAVDAEADAALREAFSQPVAAYRMFEMIRDGRSLEIPDVESDLGTQTGARELGRSRGFRALLLTPLRNEQGLVGLISVTRKEPGAFASHHVEILHTFADQAIIAIENERLFHELEARTRDLSVSLQELRAAQDRLVQAEKLASLGQLTAGIAHEIKNPLNFVTNFAALSADLTDELNDILKTVELDGEARAEADELTSMLKGNLEKVVQHGKRADSIVKNMLLHSREGMGELRPSDINAILEESLNLAYHGARAETPGFNITLTRDFDPGAGLIDAYPQEITRVFLNLITNGFYAATKRKEAGVEGFEPTLSATTKKVGDRVEIRIRDNGVGIPAEVRDKMFNPFFTTKPAGEGTGLGLSMSHDIVVKQHGGAIDVATEPGAFTEFIVTLPRTAGAQTRIGGAN